MTHKIILTEIKLLEGETNFMHTMPLLSFPCCSNQNEFQQPAGKAYVSQAAGGFLRIQGNACGNFKPASTSTIDE